MNGFKGNTQQEAPTVQLNMRYGVNIDKRSIMVVLEMGNKREQLTFTEQQAKEHIALMQEALAKIPAIVLP